MLIPYFQTSRYRVRAMVELAQPVPLQKMVDLGSGDGRIVLAFAQAGATAHGYELDDQLVTCSLEQLFNHNMHHATIYQKDFWQEELSEYEIITMYPMPDVMHDLEKKLWSELQKGAKVLLNYYSFDGWEPSQVRDHVSLYVR